MPPLPHPTPNSALHTTTTTTSHLLHRAASALTAHTKRALVGLPSLPSLFLHPRQATTIIPADYSNIDSSQPPGTIIGIVIGSVAGFLLILWLIYTLMGGTTRVVGWGATGASSSSSAGSVVIRERKRSSRRGSSRRGSSRRESVEVREVREVRRPPPAPVIERIVVEERRESRPAATVTVESSLGSEDEVVVIEEHSPPPRRASSGKKARESGYRTVDPLAYGGGDAPLRDVERRGSSRRSNR